MDGPGQAKRNQKIGRKSPKSNLQPEARFTWSIVPSKENWQLRYIVHTYIYIYRYIHIMYIHILL